MNGLDGCSHENPGVVNPLPVLRPATDAGKTVSHDWGQAGLHTLLFFADGIADFPAYGTPKQINLCRYRTKTAKRLVWLR